MLLPLQCLVGIACYAEPPRLLFVIDYSSSMAEPAREGNASRSNASELLSALQSALEALPTDVTVGVRVYGHRNSQGDRGKSCHDTELLVPFGSPDLERVVAPLRTLTPQGFSPIAYALNRALEDLTPVQPHDVIYFISDGADTCGGDPMAVLRRSQELGISIRIHTVGLKTSESANQLLGQMAHLGGGQFTEIKDLAQLGTLLPQLTFRTIQALSPGILAIRGDLGSFRDAGATQSSALRLNTGRHAHNSIGGEDDPVDRFTFSVHPGEKYSVHLHTKGPHAYRLYLRYLDARGSVLLEGDLENDHEVALDILDAGASGVAFVEVGATKGPTLDYDIEIRPLVGFE